MALLEKTNQTTKAFTTFIALLIDEESVQTAIWQIKGDKTKVLSIGERQSWEGKKIDELSESVDVSLSAAVSKLVEENVGEPEKVIFGLPQNWTENGKITKEKLTLLYQLSKKLSLKPVGFIVNTEALVHFLKVKEGVPASAILIGLNEEKIEASLIYLGKVLGIETIARSDNLALDVEEGLLRFPKEETFPPRMILYGKGDLESEKQTLVSYPWQEPERKLPFLHFPRVETAPENFGINALCLAGGIEIAKSEELVSEAGEQQDMEKIPDEKPVVTEQLEQPEQDLGFVVGKDVLEEKDIKKTEEEKKERVEEVAHIEQVEKVERESRIKSLSGSILAKVKLPRLKLPKFRLSAFAFGPPKLVLVGLFLVVLGGLFWIYKTMPKAQITIFISPQELKEEFELTLDPNVVTWDEKEKILPAQTIEASVSQSKTAITTGKKTVGDKAKGEVIIYNQTDDPKEFSDGTVLIGPGDFEFTLDVDVSVPPETPDFVSGADKWGEAKVGVTAAEIGAEYNLAADSQFSFEKFSSSSYLAKNTAAFSGGTSRQVQVVSEEDRVSLKKDLERQLIEKVKQEIQSKISGDKYFVEESLHVEVGQEAYSRKVGEEAQEVKLDLTVKAAGLVFEENTLKDFLCLLLPDKIGEQDFRWEEARLEFEAVEIDEDNSVQFKVQLAGQLYPALSEDEIIKNLTGKSWDFQKNYLNSLPKVTGFKTKITPAFFTRFGRLPSLGKNIKVEIKAE